MQQQAIVVNEPADANGLELGQAPVPAPGPGQLLVKVAATGVNFIETYQRSGVYKVDYPFTPGSEFSGVVEQIGDGVQNYKIGDRVATASGTAGYAQYALVEAKRAGKVPNAVDLRIAAALPLQGMTAHYLVHSSYMVHSGDVVLTYAGAGGVGLILTQLLKLKGATVITTASTQQKKDLAKAAGADYVWTTTRSPPPSSRSPAGPACMRCTTASARTPSKPRWPPCAAAAPWCSLAEPAARSRISTCSG